MANSATFNKRKWLLLIHCMTWTHFLLLRAPVTFSSSVISICTPKLVYDYDMGECPGGIQLRNDRQWISDSLNDLCICGNGAILQFDGEAKPWHEWIYPPDFPKDSVTFLGSWKDHNLKGSDQCETLSFNKDQPSVLLIDAKEFENPANFPSRAIELIVEPTEHKQLSGSYSIEFKPGLDKKSDVLRYDLLKTIILNSHQPVLIYPDMKAKPWYRHCAYQHQRPEVILSKYITSTWNVTNLAEECKKGNIRPFERPQRGCNTSCQTSPKWDETPKEKNLPLRDSLSFLRFFQLMGEVSIRMKHIDKRLPFTKDNQPHVALLELSARIFFRAFPKVVKLETLLNAVTIFGISFEGLIPNFVRGKTFGQIRPALARCRIQQEKEIEKNNQLYTQICKLSPSPSPKSNKFQLNQTSSTSTSPIPSQFNKLIDILWKMVQFTQIKCLQNSEHHPNVHHFYVEAMLELFTSPAVQLLWHQNSSRLSNAMLYVFPELPDRSLQMIDIILEKTHYSTYFNILRRPKIRNLKKRDMECAGHGKLIWGGRACCYFEEDDNKYRFYNRVAFAKL